MKICSDCKQEKTLSCFNYDKSRNRYFSICKKCAVIRTNNYRKKHPEKWRQNTAKHAIKYNKLVFEWKSQGCKKCGETRPHVIDAHHINPEEKCFMIGTVKRGIKITRKELKKCIPLCSNCHKDFHYWKKQKKILIEEYLKKY